MAWPLGEQQSLTRLKDRAGIRDPWRRRLYTEMDDWVSLVESLFPKQELLGAG